MALSRAVAIVDSLAAGESGGAARAGSMTMRQCIWTACVACGFLPVALVSGCGDETAAPTPISVSVLPTNASLLAGGFQDFTAMVANDPGTKGGTWAVTGCVGGAAACGGLTNVTNTTTTYAAPTPVPPDAHLGVTATSVTDNTKSFTATVAITAMRNGGEIAFETFRDGNREIYVVKVDGSGVLNLTNNLASDGFPVWSPDGTKLAFHRNGEIYAMNADGSGHLNLTNNPTFDCCAVWSADGTKLAFQTTRDGHGETYVTNDTPAAWSPDGTRIAFDTTRDGNGESYVMNADGLAVMRLTNNPAVDWCADWSPDGTKLAFFTNRDGNAEIYVMNADGSGQLNLTNNPAADGGQAATRCASWRP